MTDLDMVIAAVEEAEAYLMAFANGAPNADGKTIHPDHHAALVQAIGAFGVLYAKLCEIQRREMPS